MTRGHNKTGEVVESLHSCLPHPEYIRGKTRKIQKGNLQGKVRQLEQIKVCFLFFLHNIKVFFFYFFHQDIFQSKVKKRLRSSVFICSVESGLKHLSSKLTGIYILKFGISRIHFRQQTPLCIKRTPKTIYKMLYWLSSS